MKIALTMGFLLMMLSGYAQQSSWADRETPILKMPNDTAKVNRWNELATEIQYEDPTRAIHYLQLAIPLAKELNYEYGLSVAYTQRATLLFYETKLDSSKQLFEQAYKLALKSNHAKAKRLQALITQRYAGIYQQKQKYDSAVLAYQQAAELFTQMGDKTTVIVCYYNLSSIYNTLDDTTHALQYARETNRIAFQTGDSTYILRGYMALADAYVGAKKFEAVKTISEEALLLANRQNNLFPIGKFHLLLGTFYDHEAQYDSAIVHFDTALRAFASINLGYETSLTLQHLGHVYLQKKDFKKAVDNLEKAIRTCKELKLDQVLRLCLADLVKAEEGLGNINASLQYLKEYVAINDSVIQRNNRRVVYDLETKYQTQKKETQLQAQRNELKRKSLINYLLAGSVVSILSISFFMYYSFRQRRLLQEELINKLQREKKLLASEAVIKGQEEERGRLAKDLHDGLGGLLSGVKFSFTNMKSNVVLDADSALVFERSLDMLDHSISELRRVAHNMMPEVLVKFGLSEALKSYCASLRESQLFKIEFQSIGMDERLSSNSEIFIYRIIQELLNNTAKHAKATQVIVQLARQNEEISITVEDDGVGFDTSTITKSTGSGWANIKSRVEYLKGKLDVQSASGQGTSVHITIPVS